MDAFVILAHVGWAVLLSFLLQMMIFTAVARVIIAVQARMLWGSWRQRIDFIVVAHVMALLLFAAMTKFVEVGAPPPTFFGALFHSLAVLWPLQLVLLVIDLAIRAGAGRGTS